MSNNNSIHEFYNSEVNYNKMDKYSSVLNKSGSCKLAEFSLASQYKGCNWDMSNNYH